MQVQATRALLALLVLSAAGATACREQRTFDPAPQEPRHPRDKSGHGGAAGAGNDPAPCVTDSDCDNHKACDGEERCDAGICVSGEDPCASLAEVGCTIECEEIDGGASCLKAPLDEDGDGHVASTNTCSATSELPRDDCDDSDPNTYPGAEEVCDGVDNNCNGLSDFAEGFPLAGEFRTLFTSSADESGGNYPAACWNEPQGKWGVVWGTSKRLLFAALHPDGTVAGDPKVLIEDDTNHDYRPACTWAGATLAVVWGTQTGTSTRSFTFSRFSVDGSDTIPTPIDVVAVPVTTSNAQAPTLVQAEGGGWLLHSTISSNATVHRFSDKGALLAPTVTLGPTDWVNGAARIGERAVAVWQANFYEDDTWVGGGFQWAAWAGPNMQNVVSPTDLWEASAGVQGGTARVSPLTDGALFILRPRAGDVHVMRVKHDGSLVCGPVAITTSGLPAGVDGEVYTTGNETSAFFLARKPGEGPQVAPLPLDCDVNSVLSGRATSELANYGNVASTELASGSRGHLAVINDAGVLKARAFGSAYCDTPSLD